MKELVVERSFILPSKARRYLPEQENCLGMRGFIMEISFLHTKSAGSRLTKQELCQLVKDLTVERNLVFAVWEVVCPSSNMHVHERSHSEEKPT